MSRNPGKTAKRADSLNPVDAADSVHPAGPAGAASTTAEKPAISEEAVQAATGKNWQDWFRLLDDAGAARMTHKEIVGIVGRLDEDDRVSGWWRQSIAVAYEKAPKSEGKSAGKGRRFNTTAAWGYTDRRRGQESGAYEMQRGEKVGRSKSTAQIRLLVMPGGGGRRPGGRPGPG